MTADQILMCDLAYGWIGAYHYDRRHGRTSDLMSPRAKAGRWLHDSTATSDGAPSWRLAARMALAAGDHGSAALLVSQCVEEPDPLSYVNRPDPPPASGVIWCRSV